MIESYSCYKFEINKMDDGWVYVLYDPSHKKNAILFESPEWYEAEQEARFAAIGHINCLENKYVII